MPTSAGGSTLFTEPWLKYLRSTIHSSPCSIMSAPRSLRAELSLGKIPTTPARRLISLSSLSRCVR